VNPVIGKGAHPTPTQWQPYSGDSADASSTFSKPPDD
jgi:hypothetical protein